MTLATVAVSTQPHGISAWPGARWYAGHCELVADPDAPELQRVSEMPLRLQLAGAAPRRG